MPDPTEAKTARLVYNSIVTVSRQHGRMAATTRAIQPTPRPLARYKLAIVTGVTAAPNIGNSMRWIGIMLALALACCGKPDPYQQPKIAGRDWIILFSARMPPTMPTTGGLPYFDFPAAPGSVHYIVQAPLSKMAQGQTIIMSFSIEGAGVIVPTEGDPPARVRLFLWQNDDDLTKEFYRWWSIANVALQQGEFILSAKIASDQWSSVFGKAGNSSPGAAAGFDAAVNNLYAYGFTFGGIFAGHGDYVKTSSARFVLKSFKVL